MISNQTKQAEKIKEAIILIGTPGSGKSTWVSKFLEEFGDDNYVVISTDKWIEEFAKQKGSTYTQVFSDEVFRYAFEKAQDELNEALAKGKNIIWDQTNMDRKVRASKIARLKAEGYKIKVVSFELARDLLEERLAKRVREGGKDIPPEVIEQTINAYEPPTKEEGFDEIEFIRPTKNADYICNLVKIANKLDEWNFYKQANVIDFVIAKLAFLNLEKRN